MKSLGCADQGTSARTGKVSIGVEGLLGQEAEQVRALEQMAVLGAPAEGQLEQGAVDRETDGGTIGHGTMVVHDDDKAGAAAGTPGKGSDLDINLLEEGGPGEVE